MLVHNMQYFFFFRIWHPRVQCQGQPGQKFGGTLRISSWLTMIIMCCASSASNCPKTRKHSSKWAARLELRVSSQRGTFSSLERHRPRREGWKNCKEKIWVEGWDNSKDWCCLQQDEQGQPIGEEADRLWQETVGAHCQQVGCIFFSSVRSFCSDDVLPRGTGWVKIWINLSGHFFRFLLFLYHGGAYPCP